MTGPIEIMRGRELTRQWSGIVRALLIALAFCCVAGPLRAAEDEARVMVLYGLDPYLPPFLAMDKAMREIIAKEADRRVTFFAESLDSQRFALESIESEMAALLEKKYRALRIDVIVAVSRTALEFFERHGEALWPGARVVYAGFLGYEFKPSALPPGVSAVVSILDVGGTIDIARRLQPDARRIVLVNGVSEIDQTAGQQAREALAKLDVQVPVDFLSGLPLPELLTRVAAEPPDSIVVYLAQFRDRDGRPYEPIDVLRAVVNASGAPVYGAAETFIGLGAVAGSVASYETRGRLIGDLVRRALTGGTSSKSPTVLAAPNRCVADARALLRWSLDATRLPDDCEVRFAAVSIWRQYWWQIALSLAVVAAQAVLITILVSQLRRRRLAEEAEQVQRAALARASRLATAGELTGAIAHEINQPLGAILANVDTGELMLDSDRDRRDELRTILADIRRDDLRASEVIQRLRDLLGKQTFERKAINLNDVASDLQLIMHAEARRRNVALEIRRAPGGLAIMGDRIQLQQVLINLFVNAMDAVAEQPEDRRTVVISVTKREAVAILTVRDRGQGIPPQDQAKVFESFFSTKRNGMGLGLSITRTIVEAHRGRITFACGSGQDTIFQVELPLIVGVDAPSEQQA